MTVTASTFWHATDSAKSVAASMLQHQRLMVDESERHRLGSAMHDHLPRLSERNKMKNNLEARRQKLLDQIVRVDREIA
jgi:hypothetical protein